MAGIVTNAPPIPTSEPKTPATTPACVRMWMGAGDGEEALRSIDPSSRWMKVHRCIRAAEQQGQPSEMIDTHTCAHQWSLPCPRASSRSRPRLHLFLPLMAALVVAIC